MAKEIRKRKKLTIIHAAESKDTRCGMLLKNYNELDESAEVTCAKCNRVLSGHLGDINSAFFVKHEPSYILRW